MEVAWRQSEVQSDEDKKYICSFPHHGMTMPRNGDIGKKGFADAMKTSQKALVTMLDLCGLFEMFPEADYRVLLRTGVAGKERRTGFRGRLDD